MSKQIPKNFVKLSSDYVELEHVHSFSESHHLFHVTLMGIKYRIEFLNGEILSIDYHEDYRDCFTPLKKNQCVSDIIYERAKQVLSFYFNENEWLKGWCGDWKKQYSTIWMNKMKREPEDMRFKCSEPADSINYFLCKKNIIFHIL